MNLCTDLLANASNYDNAYWEINYVKTFTATGAVANASSSASGTAASATGTSGSSSSGNGSGATALELGSKGLFAVMGTMLAGALAFML